MAEEAKPYIEFDDVSKAFGDHRVLEDVTFQVLPAETVCIVGRSGVGKSVTLQHIMGFLKPDSGRVVVAYEDITEVAKRNWSASTRKSPWCSRTAPCSIPLPWARTWPSPYASAAI